MKNFASDFIFLLANKYQISLDNTQPSEFLDDDYYGFCEEYLQECKIRDVNLKKYLSENSSLFRTFLPWRDYILDTILQLQWYYDELIIYDPICLEINYFKTDDIEKSKCNLRELIISLISCKNSIIEGFLLFGSYETFITSNKQIEDNKFEDLLSIPKLRAECDKLVKVYKMTGSKEASYFNIRSHYRDKQTFFTVVTDHEKIKLEQGIYYDFTAHHTLISIEDVKKEGFYDRAYNFKEDYSFEIRDILNYVDIGSNIKMPVLFNRELDKLVLSSLSDQEVKVTSKANDYYKLILPFVNNIPASHLSDIRAKMPNAFLDFRNLMFDTIYDFEKNGVEQEVFELKIQQKINPLLRKLEAEMKNSVIKAKVISAGMPILTGVGALGLWSFGVDISKYVGLLVGGLNLTGIGTSLVTYLTEQRTGQSNQLYYLWKVKQ